MRSRPFTCRLTQKLYAASAKRQRVNGYKTLSVHVAMVIRCDAIMQRGHEFTTWLSRQPREIEDFVDDMLVDFPPAFIGTQPSLTHYFCAGLISVQRQRQRLDTDAAAIASLPAELRALCAANGFA